MGSAVCPCFLDLLSKNRLSYPLCHGILVGSFFIVHLFSLANNTGGLFFAIGSESEEYKMADSVDKLVGCRWDSLGAGLSAALSAIAIVVSIIPAIVSTVLVNNSSEGCKSAFEVDRFGSIDAIVMTSDENMEEVRRISFLVKRSYIYTGLPLALLSITTACSLPSVIVSGLGWLGSLLWGVYVRGGFSLKLPTDGSRLNDVLAPDGGVWYYVGMLWGCVGLAVDDSDSPTAVSSIIIFILGFLLLDMSLYA